MNNFKLVKNTEWKEVEINGEMKEIPKDWEVSNIEKSIEMEKNTKNSQILNSLILNKGIIPVIGQEVDFISGYTNNIASLSANKENPTIIFGDHSCTLKFITFDYALGGDGTKVFKGNEKIKTNFLFYSIKNLNFKTDGYKRHFSILKEKLINIPPLPIQSSIATILSAQESIIADIESLISKYESRFQYLSDELLSGRLRVKEVDGKTVLYKNPDDNWKEVEVNGEMKEIPKEWEVEKISNLFEIQRGKVISKDYIQDNKGIYPVYSSATENNGCIGYINSYMLDGEYLTWTTDGVYAGTVFYRNGRFNCTNICGTLKNKALENNLKSLFYFVKLELIKHVNHIGNSKLMSNVVADVELIFPNHMEQIYISQILSAQEILIEEQKELLEKEKQKFNWLLENLLSGNYIIDEIKD